MISKLEQAAIDWFNARKAFLSNENTSKSSDWMDKLKECTDGEHGLAAAVREYLGTTI